LALESYQDLFNLTATVSEFRFIDTIKLEKGRYIRLSD